LQLNLPKDPDSFFLKIFVCIEGERSREVLRYNGILESEIRNSNNFSNNNGNLQDSIDSAIKENDVLSDILIEFSKFLTASNVEDAPDEIKQCINLIINEHDIDSALKIMISYNSEITNPNYPLKDSEIKVIQSLEMKSYLYYTQYRFQEALKTIESIIEIFEQRKLNYLTLRKYYIRAADINKLLNRNNTTLNYLYKVIKIEDKYFDVLDLRRATTYNNVAVAYRNLDMIDSSFKYLEKAIFIRKNNPNSDLNELAISYENLGNLLRITGDAQNAEYYYESAINIFENELSQNSLRLANTYNSLSLIFQNEFDFDKALSYQNRSISTREKYLSENDPQLVVSYNNIAVSYRLINDLQKAAEYNRKALSIVENLKDYPILLADTYEEISYTYLDLNEIDSSEYFLNKAYEIKNKLISSENIQFVTIYTLTGHIYSRKSQYNQAIEYFQKALSIQNNHYDNLNLETGLLNFYLAAVLCHVQRFEEATIHITNAVTCFKQNLPKDHLYVQLANDLKIYICKLQ
jgi:tetratricopeptide (TPR) repeat protein